MATKRMTEMETNSILKKSKSKENKDWKQCRISKGYGSTTKRVTYVN